MIKWCPGPTCERAVRLPEVEVFPFVNLIVTCFSTSFLQVSNLEEISHSVDCGDGHFFCWECLGEAHAPVSCDKYQVSKV